METEDKNEALRLFEERLIENELSENTRVSYLISMRQFFQRYEKANKENGILWKKQLQDSGLHPKTVNIRISAYNKLVELDGRQEDKIKTIRIHSDTVVNNVISKEQYLKLLDGMKKDGKMREYFNVRLLASTGARVSEFIRLRKSDLDRGFAELFTKGKVRRIYIPESFRKESEEWYRDYASEQALCCNSKGRQMSRSEVWRMLISIGKRYGIDKKVMHPHSFRHLFAIEFLKRNGNLSLLSDIIGHDSVQTTAIYTRLTMQEQLNVINDTINW